MKKYEEILKNLDAKFEKLESKTEDTFHKAESGIKIKDKKVDFRF